MGAIDKFKAIFFPKPVKKTIKKKVVAKKSSHLKLAPSEEEVKRKAQLEKQEIAALKSKIESRLKSNPSEVKKAAQILEKMLHKK
jgi:hypothetical protein